MGELYEILYALFGERNVFNVIHTIMKYVRSNYEKNRKKINMLFMNKLLDKRYAKTLVLTRATGYLATDPNALFESYLLFVCQKTHYITSRTISRGLRIGRIPCYTLTYGQFVPRYKTFRALELAIQFMYELHYSGKTTMSLYKSTDPYGSMWAYIPFSEPPKQDSW